MFTTILFYFMVVMFVVGACINFFFWICELKDSYNHKHAMNEFAKGKINY